ncbi:putative 2-aminoethylphosphonate ABC transporter ATP-binding protein [Frigidibacter sp. ROC022]|uniref:putative 2-aminoethylphosphonate ABC transporter ATP-binding protein n=1 Tax=Frigidibacter sp. ROC022 TaxID=2971796 RepID=UPI00215AC137|nr:putative 2-aminoethylphosphonate ABC transporter ATP-binding protein [Frigidibacter sp. ROC022]MCR8726216.1 putative 2-aminoethylphosphonate ABC transporter ATP-binding protein [Frigidibacter sp. ROC022]
MSVTTTDAAADPAEPAKTPPEAYLTIRGLWKSFGDFIALRDISLSVAQGEFICFLGPSGCGKTTLLRAIAGLDPQSRGTIIQGGRDVSVLPASARDYGIVFQSYALFPNLTVERNVAFGLENTGVPRAKVTARVAELLELVGLPEQAQKYPAQLSGGQQQRIALARAIAIGPGLLLLDEPLSALDAKVRVHLRHEIKELQRKLGVTTIMVTHDQEEALSMADRIVVMNHGGIEQIGTPTEIYRHPATLFVADFIGETNRVSATLRGGKVALGKAELRAETDLPEGTGVTVAVRPEDILPHAGGHEAAGENRLAVTIADMEFLGSYWRVHLSGEALEGVPLVANFSMNAVRRLRLSVGRAITVELPADRVLLFPESRK